MMEGGNVLIWKVTKVILSRDTPSTPDRQRGNVHSGDGSERRAKLKPTTEKRKTRNNES
jgi:hypothetical protein